MLVTRHGIKSAPAIGGKLVVDGGFPKFYNPKWELNRKDMKAAGKYTSDELFNLDDQQYAYLYNIINYISRPDLPGTDKKILYINDSQATPSSPRTYARVAFSESIASAESMFHITLEGMNFIQCMKKILCHTTVTIDTH